MSNLQTVNINFEKKKKNHRLQRKEKLPNDSHHMLTCKHFIYVSAYKNKNSLPIICL